MALTLERLPKITKNLENYVDAVRIKEMIYCLSKNFWENEPTVLSRYSLQELLTEVVQEISTINRLIFFWVV